MTADGRSLFLHLPLRWTHELFALMLALVFLFAAQPALAGLIARALAGEAVAAEVTAFRSGFRGVHYVVA